MIDFTLLGFTLALLLVGVWHACTTANLTGDDVVEDDGRGYDRLASTIVPFVRRAHRRQSGRRAPR